MGATNSKAFYVAAVGSISSDSVDAVDSLKADW